MARPDKVITPQNFDEYRAWLADGARYDLVQREQAYYALQDTFESAVENSPTVAEFRSELKNYAEEYFIRTGLALFHDPAGARLPLSKKSYMSFLEKAYRYTFVTKKTPVGKADGDSQVLPHDYLGTIDDVLRTLVVVRFLDGVEFLVRKLDALCTQHGARHWIEYKCNEQGYFAAHYYLEIEITSEAETPKLLPFEIQITTQLQEVLRTFLHFQYEKDRGSKPIKDIPWQWRYKDDDFFSNYLGHMLRSIEGQIMDARRRRDIKDACS